MSEFTNKANEFLKLTDKKELKFILNDNPIKLISEIKALKDKKISLVFGAGISSEPFCLPGWGGLLNNVTISRLNETLDTAEKVYYKEFIKNNSNLLKESEDLYEWAQYLENALEDDLITRRSEKKFSADKRELRRYVCSAVKRALYYEAKDEEYLNDKLSFTNRNYLIQDLCVFVDKYNVDRIITYNYDDAFEYTYQCYTEKKDSIYPIFLDDQLVNCVDNDSTKHVYHVHGFITHYTNWEGTDIQSYLDLPESKEIILTEDDYDGIARTSYKWRNTVQGDTFLRYNCLFFGFSATDKNFRRIVKLIDKNYNDCLNVQSNDKDSNSQVNNNNQTHYLFLRVDEIIREVFSLSRAKKLNKNTFTALSRDTYLKTKMNILSLILRDKSRYFKKFNMEVIWFFGDDRQSIMAELLSV